MAVMGCRATVIGGLVNATWGERPRNIGTQVFPASPKGLSDVPDQSDEQLSALQRISVLQARSMALQLQLVPVGGSQINLGTYERFIPAARELLDAELAFEARWPGVFQLGHDALPLIRHLYIYADYVLAAGDGPRAAALRSEADQMVTKFLDEASAATFEQNRAMDDLSAGQFQQALIRLDHAQQVLVARGMVLEAARALIQLANVYEWLCDYQRALETLTRAQDLVAPRLTGGVPSKAEVLLGLGRDLFGILRGRGDAQDGQQALLLRGIFYEIIQGRARVHRWLGNYVEAQELFEQARPFVESFEPAAIDFHLAVIAINRAELAKADDLLRKIEPRFHTQLLRSRLGALRQAQADLSLAQGRPAEALRHANDGLALQQTNPDLDLAWRLSWRRARALRRLGDSAGAITAYQASVQAVDTLRMTPLGYLLDTRYVQDKLPMVEEAIDTAVAANDASHTVEFVEMIKSRALSAILSHPGRSDRSSDDAAQFDRLSSQLDAIAYRMHAGDGTDADRREREELLKARANVLERIRIHDPRWRSMTEPAPIDVGAVERWCQGSKTRVLTLYQRGHRIVSVLLGGKQALIGDVITSAATQVALDDYARNLRRGQPDWYLFDISGEREVGLADLVGPAIAHAATEAERLVVVPHGNLHLLPWSTLTVGAVRLFQHTAVGVLPNLAALRPLSKDFPSAPRAMLFGNPDYSGLRRYAPLAEAGAELAELSALYGSDQLRPAVTGPEATEEALLGLLDQQGAGAAILHVSSHGSLEGDQPLSSGLILTSSILDAAEISQRRCGYPEVVLSACSTGWRPQAVGDMTLAGDDALGLTASFLEAGASFLTVSVPKFEDKAARAFSLAWHRHRRQCDSPLQAYRQAQCELFAQDRESVWSWAGITAYGCR